MFLLHKSKKCFSAGGVSDDVYGTNPLIFRLFCKKMIFRKLAADNQFFNLCRVVVW